MPLRRLALLACLLPLTACATPTDSSTLTLGTVDEVSQLFTYPNCLNQCPDPAPTLEQTVAHYLQLSLERDGYPQGQITLWREDGNLKLRLQQVPASYATTLTDFLDAGRVALAASKQIKADGKWQDGWYFFLPLGIAMQNQYTVELLHFPPDTVLTRDQDYLAPATTRRWADLLSLHGVAPADTVRYQTIIDIAPIAANAKAGKQLEGVYDYFSSYSKTLLAQWTAPAAASQNQPRPLVVFGAPARDWLSAQFNTPKLDVLSLTQISPAAQRVVPVLAANHPSLIWYVSDPKNQGGDQQKADAAGLAVMRQDLKAACWQAQMGRTPAASAQITLQSCESRWDAEPVKSCELFFTSVRRMDAASAAQRFTKEPN